jgi:hypothetical protein
MDEIKRRKLNLLKTKLIEIFIDGSNFPALPKMSFV